MRWNRGFGPFGGRTRSLWGELDRLQNEMERLYSDIKRPFFGGFPALNVWTNSEEALVTAELPGVSIDDLDISVVGNTLSITGSRKPADETARYHRQERELGSFARTLELPFKVASDQVQASMSRGVLSIKLPRAEEDKPRKINVQVG